MEHQIDPQTAAAVQQFFDRIAERYDVAAAILYGSRARGSHRPDSDADVAVLLRDEHRRLLAVTSDMADTAFDVLLETGILISPMPIWVDEWVDPATHANPALLRHIGRQGTRIDSASRYHSSSLRSVLRSC